MMPTDCVSRRRLAVLRRRTVINTVSAKFNSGYASNSRGRVSSPGLFFGNSIGCHFSGILVKNWRATLNSNVGDCQRTFHKLLTFKACAFATRRDRNRLSQLFAVFPSERAAQNVLGCLS